MTDRPLIFVDANTIWHWRLAEAVGALGEAVAILPQGRLLPGAKSRAAEGGLRTVALHVVPGWASKTAAIGQRQIAAGVRKVAQTFDVRPAIVLTSPKYRRLARMLRGEFPLVYYCADDYREYQGWGGSEMREAEADVILCCELAVFVSDALRDRAVSEYGVRLSETMISPNATEARFLTNGSRPADSAFAGAARPLFGILGGLSGRLDLELIQAVIELETVKSFAIIGPVDEFVRRMYASLCEHPKVIITGRMPHSEMHRYALALDAALIPYALAAINYFCSPMRLYDHLATGTNIYSTDACHQINEYNNSSLKVESAAKLPARISRECSDRADIEPLQMADPGPLLWSSRARKLLARIGRL